MSDQDTDGKIKAGISARIAAVAQYSWLAASLLGAVAFLVISFLTIGHFRNHPFVGSDAFSCTVWVLTPLLVSVASFWRFRASDSDVKILRETLSPSVSAGMRYHILSFCTGLCTGTSGIIVAACIIGIVVSQKHGGTDFALYGAIAACAAASVFLSVYLLKAFSRYAPGALRLWSLAAGVAAIVLIAALGVLGKT
jgi:hypothetical protein